MLKPNNDQSISLNMFFFFFLFFFWHIYDYCFLLQCVMSSTILLKSTVQSLDNTGVPPYYQLKCVKLVVSKNKDSVVCKSCRK